MGHNLSKDTSIDVQEEETTSASDVKIMKQSFAGRLRSKILRSPPSSVSLSGEEEEVTSKPIAVERSCDTPVKMMLVDPRSPGMVMGDRGVTRTPLLVTQKREEQEERKCGRGVIPPAFSLPDPPSEDSLLSSGDPRSPAPSTLGPRTPITSNPPPIKSLDQPVNMLQEKMKEAAVAAMIDTAANATPSAATGE
jgi:hypothetical protein